MVNIICNRIVSGEISATYTSCIARARLRWATGFETLLGVLEKSAGNRCIQYGVAATN